MSFVKRFAIGLSAAVGIAVAAAPIASAGAPAQGQVYDDRGGVCYYFQDGVTLGNLWVGQTTCIHHSGTDLVDRQTGAVEGKELGSINIPGGPGVTAAWWY